MAEVDIFTRLIFFAMQAGLSHAEACHGLTAYEVCDFVTCHWESIGLEIEPMSCNDHGMREDVAQKFSEISNRQKSWQFPQA